MSEETVTLSVKEGVAEVRFGDGRGNILTCEVLEKLREVAQQLTSTDVGVWAVVLCGRGEHFSYGASVEEHLPGRVEKMLPLFNETLRVWATVPLPVFCVVQGYCLGGGFELALAADFRIAVKGMRGGLPEITLSVFPPFAIAVLEEETSWSKALELITTGRVCEYEELRELFGWQVNSVEEGLELVHQQVSAHYRTKSRAVLRLTTGLLKQLRWQALEQKLKKAEEVYLHQLMKMADPVEGLTSFLEKRKPQWTHRSAQNMEG